jgi:hypothetical protein
MYQVARAARAVREGWRGKVYRVKAETGLKPAEWRVLRDAVLERDNYTCQRCDKKYRTKSKLSVHHIIARVNGGSNEMENLITLCHPCHDWVEINADEQNGLLTRAGIMGSLDDPMVGVSEPDDQEDEDPYHRPEWHKYVYGGKRGKR